MQGMEPLLIIKMIRQGNQLQPIFSKISANRNKRLDPASLKQVISTVRVMQKRGSPTGCSYNPSANIKDLDLALEQSKRREQDFDNFISKELKKLNCLKPRSSSHKGRHLDEEAKAHELGKEDGFTADEHQSSKLEDLSKGDLLAEQSIKSKEESKKAINEKLEETQFLSTVPEQELSDKPQFKYSTGQLPNSTKTRMKSISPAVSAIRSKVSQDFITRLSTPTTKFFNLPHVNRNEILKETKKADKLMSKCMQLNKEFRDLKHIRHIEEAENFLVNGHINEFLTGKKFRLRRNSSNNYLEDQIKLDLKIAKNMMRGKKVWKLNHVSFIATVDRMINSVPQVKK